MLQTVKMPQESHTRAWRDQLSTTGKEAIKDVCFIELWRG